MAVTRTISTLLKLEGDAEYKAQLQNINREYATHKAELKAVEAAYKGSANSMEALVAKGKALQQMQEDQQKKLNATTSVLAEATAAEAKYSAEMDKSRQAISEAESELARLRLSTEDTTEEEARLSAEIEKHQKALDAATASQAMASNTINRYQKGVYEVEAALSDLDGELQKNKQYQDEAAQSADGCATSIDGMGKSTKQSADAVGALASALVAAGVVAGLKKVTEALHECVDASIEFESAITGVYKTVDGTDEQLQAISDGIKELSTVIPVSTTEIAAVAEAAGQLGIATDDVLGFTEVMIKLGSATNLSSEEAATSLARWI